MESKSEWKNITGKVLLGYLVIFALGLASSYYLIRAATRSTPQLTENASVKKLGITSRLLSEIMDSKAFARLFLTTGDSVYLIKTIEKETTIEKLLDSISALSLQNTDQFLRMKIVDSLIRERSKIFLKFEEFNRDPEAGRLNSLRQEINRTSQQLMASGSVTSSRMLARKINPLISEYTSASKIFSQEFADRELALINTDHLLMNEIRQILLLFEREEINLSIAEANSEKGTVDNLWRIALTLGAASLVALLLFIFFIWRDVTRSDYLSKRLIEARADAERSLKVKEQFLANMSHEIRTPITGIIGFSEQMARTPLSSKQGTYMHYIRNSSEHLLALVNDLLDLTKIEANKIVLENDLLSPDDLVREVVDSQRPAAKAKNISILYESGFKKWIWGDPLRIRQIAINLIGNSIKFTDSGVIRVVLDENDNGTFTFSVSDTGIGIPEEKQKVIFDDFVQLDGSTKNPKEGSGLGLAITRKLADLMNGEISLSSKPGEGTTICITLPFREAEAPETLKQETENIVPRFEPEEVLVVEDDITSRILLEEHLKQWNLIPVSVDNGLAALNIFNAKHYRLIITDIQMPEMSGIELADRIKDTCRQRGTPCPRIIGMSAHMNKKMIQDLILSSFDDVLLKPFYENELLEKLSHWVNPSAGEVQTPVRLTDEQAAYRPEFEPAPDLSAFEHFAGEDREAFRSILNSLSDNLLDTFAGMDEAYRMNDLQKLGKLAHRILPNIRLMKLTDTERKLVYLEEAAFNGEATVEEVFSPEQFNDLHDEFKALADFLKKN